MKGKKWKKTEYWYRKILNYELKKSRNWTSYVYGEIKLGKIFILIFVGHNTNTSKKLEKCSGYK